MGGEWSLSEPRLPAKVVEDSKKNDEGIVIKMQNCPFHIKMQNCKLIKSISHYQVQLVFACFSYGLIIIFLQVLEQHRFLQQVSFLDEVPTSWSGRLWGQTLCTENSSGKFSCLTEDCGSSTLECSSSGASPPATLAEFTLNGAEEVDFYDVSLVDGYNLPMMVSPNGGTGGNRTLAFIGGAITILAAMRQLWHLF
ncbi:hypothetical protein Gohar_012251 [Gossypium harknessii]|uniref:Uncharacterized protein n=1 Tax=Gossypium harknessii TaxID=34285 RepID=A0A7J9GWI1_9ROSI|nr:hypothetical protein [Gossypium harknessii]